MPVWLAWTIFVIGFVAMSPAFGWLYGNLPWVQ